MTSYFSSDFTLGILGGGQLGKMLLYETRKYDIRTMVMDPNPEAPCRIACNQFVQGDLMDFQHVVEFGKQVDLLTIEIEAVNVDALQFLEEQGKRVYPSATTLRRIQDKGVQKQFYAQHNIPTSAFEVYASKEDLMKDIQLGKWEFPFVWKIRAGGYDGKGVRVLRSEQELEDLPPDGCIAEKLIPFKNELAVIVSRSPSGEMLTYPVVEMEFHPEANQVEYVLSPARLTEDISLKAIEIAKKVSLSFEHVGLLAVEMFLTQDDHILVNEVAPRTHNSGHFSIEASYTTQFEQHLRSVLNLPLGSTQSKTKAVMINLVGEEGHTGPVHYENLDEAMKFPGVVPHIYGKRQTRPFRKMGHVTVVNEDLEEARKIAEKVKNSIRVISKS